MAPIETPRLVLRLPTVADAEPYMEFMWDPEVVEAKVGATFERADADPINGESIHIYGIDRPT